MKIVFVSKWLMPFGYGLTIWKTVYVRKDTGNIPYVIAHEAEHVRQWEKYGKYKFPFLYLKELINNGYKRNKFEVLARVAGRIHYKKYKEYEYGNI